MLNNLSVVIETEEIHGHVLLALRPRLMGVKRNQVALGNDPNEFDRFFRKLLDHFGEVVNEGLLAVAHRWVVLKVVFADIPLHGVGSIAGIGHAIERDGVLLVRFQVVNHLNLRRD